MPSSSDLAVNEVEAPSKGTATPSTSAPNSPPMAEFSFLSPYQRAQIIIVMDIIRQLILG